jgi:hypothetical protein
VDEKMETMFDLHEDIAEELGQQASQPALAVSPKKGRRDTDFKLKVNRKTSCFNRR